MYKVCDGHTMCSDSNLKVSQLSTVHCILNAIHVRLERRNGIC